MMATALKSLNSAEAARLEIEAFLEANQRKSLLRFITCGSVDDGKSTLIGRLLYDSKLLFDDQLAALHSDSRKAGIGDGLDLAALRAHLLRVGLERGELVLEDQLGIVEQPPDQGGLAVVHRAAGEEAQLAAVDGLPVFLQRGG